MQKTQKALPSVARLERQEARQFEALQEKGKEEFANRGTDYHDLLPKGAMR